MSDLERYFDEVRDMAEDAGEAAKTLAGDVVNRAKKLTDEDSKARELAKSAKEQTVALTHGVKEKVQSVFKDEIAVKELKQGVAQLETLPEIDGSILYRMELETSINYLNSLQLIISDKRMDSDSVAEEIRKVMDKIQPAADQETAESDEQQAIENVKLIAYNACTKAMEALYQN